jgi:hypothetical protein
MRPTTPRRHAWLPLSLCRLERLSSCRTLFAAERLLPSARERVPLRPSLPAGLIRSVNLQISCPWALGAPRGRLHRPRHRVGIDHIAGIRPPSRTAGIRLPGSAGGPSSPTLWRVGPVAAPQPAARLAPTAAAGRSPRTTGEGPASDPTSNSHETTSRWASTGRPTTPSNGPPFGTPGPCVRASCKAVTRAPLPPRARERSAAPSRRSGSDRPAPRGRSRGRRPRTPRGIPGEDARATAVGGQPRRRPHRGFCPILWCVQPQKRHFGRIFIVAAKASSTTNYGKSCQDQHAWALTKREDGRIIRG